MGHMEMSDAQAPPHRDGDGGDLRLCRGRSLPSSSSSLRAKPSATGVTHRSAGRSRWSTILVRGHRAHAGRQAIGDLLRLHILSRGVPNHAVGPVALDQKLGSDADKLNYVFVSIDPARDTPALMHTYLSSFDKHIRGFTGTPAEVAWIAKEYRVYYKRIATDDGGYVWTTRHHLFDGSGRQIRQHDRLSRRRCLGARQTEKPGGNNGNVVLKRGTTL